MMVAESSCHGNRPPRSLMNKAHRLIEDALMWGNHTAVHVAIRIKYIQLISLMMR